jgi:hypothetical protein
MKRWVGNVAGIERRDENRIVGNALEKLIL